MSNSDTQAQAQVALDNLQKAVDAAKEKSGPSVWDDCKAASKVSLKVAAYVAPAVLIIGAAVALVSWISPKSSS